MQALRRRSVPAPVRAGIVLYTDTDADLATLEAADIPAHGATNCPALSAANHPANATANLWAHGAHPADAIANR